MKKSRYVILSITAFIIVVIVAILIFNNNIQKDDNGNANQQSEYASSNIENDEDGIETIEVDEYTILLKGVARPKNEEISVEEAAKIGVKELEKEYNIDINNEVEMIYLDDILTNTGTWSGHLNLSDTEKYEFLIDSKDGSLEFVNKSE